ncbi:hypothetical protein CERSUDRAFT_72350 [Gelatoporia subvermispora B]|uniref:Uncharacterized protein n=1 Tax=Ceriporiopsis subvermispora (strain B) TaxID=914234 RepID=M2RKZ6_CERS8|nr:hypothetical protein CERSUDRAFT_72350 [Gelatoporia subvermispora B]
MGFFKRFLSLGSRKSKAAKKKQQQSNAQVDHEGRIVHRDESEEQNANRLLRSSSAHFSVVAEVDYASLPPLPHPINRVAATPPISPARSASTCVSIKRRGTYNVKVLGRTQHSRTEFPHANPPLPVRNEPVTPEHDTNERRRTQTLKEVIFTPRDQSRLLTLRRDPSVASLLNMYDEHGQLDSTVFSNTPPSPVPLNQGREPTKRSGSTLRQLLGNPEVDSERDNNATEGDISWAERFLGERLDAYSPSSSMTSLNLITPTDAPFHNDPSPSHIIMNSTFSSEHESSMNYPAISSLEVELSGDADPEPSFANISSDALSLPLEPKTPQRASEVFGFLTERRKSLRLQTPRAPGMSTSSSTSSNTSGPSSRETSGPPTPETALSTPTSFGQHSECSQAQVQLATLTKLTTASAVLNPFSASSLSISPTYEPKSQEDALPKRSSTRLTKGLPDSHVTTNTNAFSERNDTIPQGRMPRGPRPLTPSRTGTSASSVEYQQDLRDTYTTAIESSYPTVPKKSTTSSRDLTELRHDSYTHIPSRHRNRGGSRSTATLKLSTDSEETRTPRSKSNRRRRADLEDKENSREESPDVGRLPSTPCDTRMASTAPHRLPHPPPSCHPSHAT